mgnify:CR=1 FL=1
MKNRGLVDGNFNVTKDFVFPVSYIFFGDNDLRRQLCRLIYGFW